MHDLIPFPLTAQPTGLDDLIRKANDLMHSAKADSTRKAYRTDWRVFESWCQAHNLPSLPSTPQTVALYITDCANHLAAATISRRLASISKAHQAAGFKDSPASSKHFVVGEVLKGARRKLGVAQKGKDPLLLDDVRRIVAACPANLLGLRDRALVIVGFAGAFRRSELVSIDVSDLTFSEEAGRGLIVHLRHSKTDQEGEGCDVAIPFGEHEETCPVAALRAYLSAAAIKQGKVFRGINRHGKPGSSLHANSVATILKRAAMRAGIDPTNVAGHSVRAGMATQAAMNGAGERQIAKTTRHKSQRVLRRYIRTGKLFRDNASSALGL
jgi:integrase